MVRLSVAVFVAVLCYVRVASLYNGKREFPARDFVRRRMQPSLDDYAPRPYGAVRKPYRDYVPRRVQTHEDDAELKQYDEELRRPMIALLKRGIVPDFSENDMETFVNSARLLDAVLRDGGTVKGGDVIYRFGSGSKQECVDGEKSIPAQCQWTGMVQWTGEDELTETKLSVADKYCGIAGLDKPKNKVVEC